MFSIRSDIYIVLYIVVAPRMNDVVKMIDDGGNGTLLGTQQERN